MGLSVDSGKREIRGGRSNRERTAAAAATRDPEEEAPDASANQHVFHVATHFTHYRSEPDPGFGIRDPDLTFSLLPSPFSLLPSHFSLLTSHFLLLTSYFSLFRCP